MNTGSQSNPPIPRVWVVYRDNRKDMSRAEKFGQLTDLFVGRVNYDRAVEQARKMLENYKDGDFILMIGDPALCGIIMTIALEYSESQVLNLLRWDRDDVEYRPLELNFNDEVQPANGVRVDSPDHFQRVEAEVIRKTR